MLVHNYKNVPMSFKDLDFLSRYQQSGSFCNLQHSGGIKQILNVEQVKFINDKMSENDELTVAKLKNKLAEECNPIKCSYHW